MPLHLLLAFVALVGGLVSGEPARAGTNGGAPAALALSAVPGGDALDPADAVAGRPAPATVGLPDKATLPTRIAAPAVTRASPVTRHDRAHE